MCERACARSCSHMRDFKCFLVLNLANVSFSDFPDLAV